MKEAPKQFTAHPTYLHTFLQPMIGILYLNIPPIPPNPQLYSKCIFSLFAGSGWTAGGQRKRGSLWGGSERQYGKINRRESSVVGVTWHRTGSSLEENSKNNGREKIGWELGLLLNRLVICSQCIAELHKPGTYSSPRILTLLWSIHLGARVGGFSAASPSKNKSRHSSLNRVPDQ